MARNEKAREERFDRRTYVKLAGFGILSASVVASAATEISSAATTGYGEGGYGANAYGGTSTASSPVVVTAQGATDVSANAATLVGSVSDLGGAASASVWFEYRPTGASGWTATSKRTVSSTGSFQTSVSSLQSGTSYEVRANATASDGDAATSTVTSFTTMHTIVVDGSPAPTRTCGYVLTVSGRLEKSGRLGSLQANDTVSGSTATGEVVGGKDAYRFTGQITDLRLDDTANVSVDGTSVDPTTLRSTPSVPNTVIIDGTATPGVKSTYTLTVTGQLRKDAGLGSVQSNDVISGSTVSGEVVGGTDAYRYSGEIASIDVSGPAAVTIDDMDG